MPKNSWVYLLVILGSGFVATNAALAQTATQRAERQLALTEASQTVQRFFTCIGEGVNSNGDPQRDARAESCMRDNLHPDAIVVFNGIPLNGADAIVATFTRQGVGAQQFANAVIDVHTIVDKDFRRRIGVIDPKIKLRVTVVTTFTNTITTPVLPLPPGNFILNASEEFELEEEEPGRWVINRVDVRTLANVPIPDNSFPSPFPVVPGVPRNP